MAQNRKYFGMTTTQVAVLAGLAALVCLLFTVAGCFFLQGTPTLFAPRAPQNTLPPPSTATPFVLPTLTPTETLTPAPYEMLIPDGWAQFKTTLVEIWLPKDFKKTKPKASDNPTDLMPELEITGPGSASSVYPVFVLISYEPMTVDSLDSYLELQMASLSTNEVRLVEKRKVNLNSVDAIRLTAEMKIETYEFNDMMYVFQDGSTVWVVQYLAQINDFYTMMETFEKSIKTFRIVR